MLTMWASKRKPDEHLYLYLVKARCLGINNRIEKVNKMSQLSESPLSDQSRFLLHQLRLHFLLRTPIVTNNHF